MSSYLTLHDTIVIEKSHVDVLQLPGGFDWLSMNPTVAVASGTHELGGPLAGIEPPEVTS